MARILKAFFAIVIFLLAFDVGGAIVCFVAEVLGWDFMALYYALWFVAGALCGLLAYNSAGKQLGGPLDVDWSNTPESGKWGLTAIALTAPLLLILSAVFFKVFWQGRTGGHYVPDSMTMSLTFFVSVFASMVLGHIFLRPATSKPSNLT